MNRRMLIVIILVASSLVLNIAHASLIGFVNAELNKSINISNNLGLSPGDYGCYVKNEKWYCPEPVGVGRPVLVKFTTDLFCVSSNLSSYDCTPDECGLLVDYGCGARVEVMENVLVDSCFIVINDSGVEKSTCSKITWEKGTELLPFIPQGAVDFSKCTREKGNESVTFQCPMKGKEVMGYFTVAGNPEYPTLMLWEEKSLIDYTTIIIIAIGMVLLGAFYYFNKKKKGRKKGKKRRYA